MRSGPSATESADEKTDPLFGSGFRIAHERQQNTADGRGAKLRALAAGRLSIGLAWRADPAAFATVALAQLLSGLTIALGLLLTRSVLNVLLGGHFHGGYGLAGLVPIVAVLGGLAMVRGLCEALSTRASGRLGPQVARMAKLALLERVVRVELTTIEQGGFHNLLAAARRGADEAQQFVQRSVALLQGSLSILAGTAIVFALYPPMTPLVLISLAPRVWGAARVISARHASVIRRIDLTRRLDLMMSIVTQRDGGEEVRVHQAGEFLLRHYRRLSADAEREQRELAGQEARTQLLSGSVAGLSNLCGYGVLVLLVALGEIPIAVAGTIALAVRSATSSLSSLVYQFQSLAESGMYIADWARACEVTEQAAIPSGGQPVGPLGPDVISAHELRFRYPGTTRYALDGVTAEIRRGEVVAFVGENGSGKSTLAKLLTGLYQPVGGSVRWDGVDLDRLARANVFDQVALIGQDFVQWPFTARINVVIGRPDEEVDEARLAEVADLAGADRVVAGLDKGWETLLAREFWGGTNLSGGQWQRFGLARAWYRDAPVMIFDEPTSALDPRAELEVFDQVVDAAGAGRAVVLITHRLASVSRADRIYVLADGRVVEQGTHQELLAANGNYATMYRLQAEQFDPAG